MATLDFSDLTPSGQSSANNTLNFDSLSPQNNNKKLLNFDSLTTSGSTVDSTHNLPGYEEETLADKVALLLE